MKLNYFGYHIEKTEDNMSYLYDIRALIRTFCNLDSVTFKNSFQYNNEQIYLFPAAQDIYLFVMTRSNEVIKKINTNDLNVNEIYELLDQGEQLGFASYVYIQNNFLGFASTFLAPKIPALVHLIDEIFRKVDLGHYRFIAQALLHQASKEEVLQLPFLGRTTIEIEKENSMAADILNFVGGNADDVGEVESFEIVIKPKKRKNIQPIVKKFVNSIPDDGLGKLIIKAKDELQDHLTDLYLVGKGAISETINTREENAIYEHIVNKTNNNMHLELKVEEFSNDERFTEATPEDINSFIDVNSWTPYLPNIQ